MESNCQLGDYTVAGHTYSKLNIFYRAPSSGPSTQDSLLVFLHGLGGSSSQFETLLATSSFNDKSRGPYLAIDLPGCGKSGFEPTTWEAYRLLNLATLLDEVIDDYRRRSGREEVVLIAHSLGCSLAALLSSSSSSLAEAKCRPYIKGLVAICPRGEPLTPSQISQLAYVPYIPVLLFDALRYIDRWRGLASPSVTRYVGDQADQETRLLQLRFNSQSRSPVLLRMLVGLAPESGTVASDAGGFPGRTIWAGVDVPILCIAGQSDQICPPHNAELIADWCQGRKTTDTVAVALDGDNDLPLAAGGLPPGVSDRAASSNGQRHAPSSTSSSVRHTQFHLITLPAPAGHGLLYDTSTVAILGKHIGTFLGSLTG